MKSPSLLYVVRHGESGGNVARDLAEASGVAVIDIADRDMDVSLSQLGERQARALAAWVGALPIEARPTVILSSPYARAAATAAIVRDGARLVDAPLVLDERLREKEFGMLDRLTKSGIVARYPEQDEARRRLGKFYYRPPSGESWADVTLRLRSLVDSMSREYSGERVLIVSHQVVVSCLRYLLERLTEKEILEIDRTHSIANCSVTSYAFDPDASKHGDLVLRMFNFVAPIEDAGEQVTEAPDAQAGAR